MATAGNPSDVQKWPDPAYCDAILDLDMQYYQCRLEPGHVIEGKRVGKHHVHTGQDDAGQSYSLTWVGE